MEEMKLIVSMVENLSGDATTAFVWWLIMDKGLMFLAIVAVVGAAAYTFLRAVRLHHQHELNKDLALHALNGVGRQLGVRPYPWYDRDVVEAIHKKVAELERRASLNHTTEK